MEPDGLYRIRKTDLARCAQVSAGAFQFDPALKYQLVGGEENIKTLTLYFNAIFQTGFPYYQFYATSPAVEGLIGYLPPEDAATPPPPMFGLPEKTAGHPVTAFSTIVQRSSRSEPLVM